MGFIILAAFIGVPLIEIALFIIAGREIGVLPTLAVVILTAFAGTFLLRSQGRATIRRAQMHLDKGEMPVEEVFTGVFLLVAGALLLTPGFFTDALGFLLFVPPVRVAIGRAVFRALMKRSNIKVHVSPGYGPGAAHPGKPNGGRVIDGEFKPVEPDTENGDQNNTSR